MDLSIVIPMFNEAENVRSTLDRVEEALSSFDGTCEIVAVNDGSLDSTFGILNRLAEQDKKIKVVSHSKNIGRGMALRQGFQESRCGYRINAGKGPLSQQEGWEWETR
jgi:glycosyltransferase involved in cell wall biosynthesis